MFLDSLKRRITLLSGALNRMKGVKCQEPEGALYLFPRIHFPEHFLAEAQAMNRLPDTLYCLRLLEATGICIVPGSGFDQQPGTYHVRLTCLPSEEHFPAFIRSLSDFHEHFMSEYGA